MARLFVGIWPSEAVAAQLGHALDRLESSPEPGVRPVPPENWHITLRFIGDADVAVVTELLRVPRLRPTVATIGTRVERLGRGQLVLPVTGVDDLAATVRAATEEVGVPVDRPYFGHLTIARTRRDAPSVLSAVEFDATMPVDEIALIESDLQSSGPVYTTRAVFPTD